MFLGQRWAVDSWDVGDIIELRLDGNRVARGLPNIYALAISGGSSMCGNPSIEEFGNFCVLAGKIPHTSNTLTVDIKCY